MCREHLHLAALVELAMPPHDEMVDLIEQAFLEGQIDGLKADLAYLLLRVNQRQFSADCYPIVLPKEQSARRCLTIPACRVRKDSGM